jgi:hypothetical protein
MSGSQDVDRPMFLLDGREELGADYDKFADVLYLWRGDAPRAAVSLTSVEGHLVRIDAETGELAGFTIFGWEGELNRQGPIRITVPALSVDDDDDEPRRRQESRTHELELVPA